MRAHRRAPEPGQDVDAKHRLIPDNRLRPEPGGRWEPPLGELGELVEAPLGLRWVDELAAHDIGIDRLGEGAGVVDALERALPRPAPRIAVADVVDGSAAYRARFLIDAISNASVQDSVHSRARR